MKNRIILVAARYSTNLGDDVIYEVVDGKNVKVVTLAADNCDFEYVVSSLKSGSHIFKIRAIRKADDIKGYGSYSKEVTVKVK